MTINYIVYSHTDYARILEIQTEYVQKYKSKTLLINKNSDVNMEDIYRKYDRVIFYDDSTPYATRLLTCLLQLDMDYILLIHDNDILLHSNDDVLSDLNALMIEKDIDRIDLKHLPYDAPDHSSIVINEQMYLVRQLTPGFYIYNVNPSIWKRSVFIELLTAFKHKGYRDIEHWDVQYFCLRYRVYKLHTDDYLKCGYLDCPKFFKFLHISHSGKLLTPTADCKTEYGQSYIDANDDLKSIITKYFPELKQ